MIRLFYIVHAVSRRSSFPDMVFRKKYSTLNPNIYLSIILLAIMRLHQYPLFLFTYFFFKTFNIDSTSSDKAI